MSEENKVLVVISPEDDKTEEMFAKAMPVLKAPDSLSAENIEKMLAAKAVKKKKPAFRRYAGIAVAAVLAMAIGFGAVLGGGIITGPSKSTIMDGAYGFDAETKEYSEASVNGSDDLNVAMPSETTDMDVVLLLDGVRYTGTYDEDTDRKIAGEGTAGSLGELIPGDRVEMVSFVLSRLKLSSVAQNEALLSSQSEVWRMSGEEDILCVRFLDLTGSVHYVLLYPAE